MIRAVKEYLRECGRLLVWVFFQPSKLRVRMRQISPEIAEKRGSLSWLRQVHSNMALRRLLIQVFLVILILPFVIDVLIGLTIAITGYDFNWTKSFKELAKGVAFGITFGVAFGILFSNVLGVAGGVRVGVAFGIAFDFALGITLGVAGGLPVSALVSVTSGVAFGVAFGIASGVVGGVVGGVTFGSTGDIAFGTALGVAGGIALGLSGNLTLGITGSRIAGIAGGVAGFVAGTKSLFYIVEVWLARRAYRLSLTSNFPEQELLRSPVGFDEMVVWPQPHLSSLLLRVYEKNPDASLRLIGKVACMPFQRWAAQKALRILLENEQRSFFSILDRLLTSPEPYVPSGFAVYERKRESDQYFSTKLLLAELIPEWPKAKQNAPEYWPSDYLARGMTFWLRRHVRSPYAELANIYFQLLNGAGQLVSQVHGVEQNALRTLRQGDFPLLSVKINQLANYRELPYGEEFYETLFLVWLSLQCNDLQGISTLRDDFAALFEIEAPLRPQIVKVFRRLRDAAVDATSFLTAEHELTRRDALLKAGGVLEEARQLANDVYEPERSLLLAVIEHWRRMFAVEGGRVAEKAEVETLPNPYVAGRPIRPEDGRLFAGRREEMKLIEEKLQTGVGIVIWGQRRIGKTSILLHLRERLPHDLLPVYLDMQLLMAYTTGGQLRAFGKEIVKQLSPQFTIRAPQSADFDREPYESFNDLLGEIERQLKPGQRVLLSFDEFEALEQRVNDGKIEKEIFAYLRGVTQTGRGFALMFAGLHTLEQMTREYWNPFFQSVQTVRIGYLSELDAEQLIRDPMEQFPLDYELEAVNRITEVTRSHPYLTQSLCHNLVNRLNDPLHRSQKATREDVDAVLERTLESSGYYFGDYVWGKPGDGRNDERLALALLAEAGEEAAFPIVEKHLGREAALEATRKLVAHEILTERTAAGELVFRFQIPLARLWVQRTKSSARILLERQKP